MPMSLGNFAGDFLTGLEKAMKKLFTIALCALCAAATAQATTYYVNANRPNNNGSGRSLAAAKKTIQAAVNLAKAGDTILVYPGEYAPIKTNNKKITIKAVRGATKTSIFKPAKQQDIALAQLGQTYWEVYSGHRYSSAPFTKGKSTTLTGFLLDGKNREAGYDYNFLLAVSGGTARSCSIRRLGSGSDGCVWAADNASLSVCTILANRGRIAAGCVLSRCQIKNNEAHNTYGAVFYSSVLANCLIAGNRFLGTEGEASHFDRSTLVNCTIANNDTLSPYAPFSTKSKYYNCILRNNTRGSDIHNVDAGNAYSRTYKNNANPRFVNATSNFKLSKGSPCINKGAVPAAIRSFVGTVDLAGVKRVRGSAIDLGCYEY